MFKRAAIAIFLITLVSANKRPPWHHPQPDPTPNPPCRFAPGYSLEQVVQNPEPFIQDVLYWEGKFVQPGIGSLQDNAANGLTYDGTLINQTTGLTLPYASGRHNFSAASKESLHIMLLAQALTSSPSAARVLSPSDPAKAPEIAFKLLEQKLDTYLDFNRTYPGFGGFLPWYNNTFTKIEPTNDWVNRLPALDNGELVWAVYAAVQALSQVPSYRPLAAKWQAWLDYNAAHSAKIFYQGQGKVCAVATLNQSLPPNDPGQKYTCEGSMLLNDPYEGELFTWYLYFFAPSLSPADKTALWTVKRPMLQSTTYTTPQGPITVQKGYWFSAHEQWKILEMPYYDVDIVRRVFNNNERARTCNSQIKHIPGMYASVNNITDASNQIIGYISAAGIPSIAFIPKQELDVITPYSVFPTLFANRSVGAAWLWNMLQGKKMQNPYGTTESERVDGRGVSSFVSWDSKITTVVALGGGVGGLVREKLKGEGRHGEFLRVVEREYGRVFKDLKGEDIDFCLPKARVPDAGLKDYTNCKAK
ncbi:hypothetical protein PRZ48_002687 [Zasmidium cellare]|uniref:Endo-beta-1,2-glucanase SGL domain-containing protein n=1 Tax=Zasmidium cellare TaxID=395010 RepID=A0ABR0ETC4_ZASCE|nr:hypothetical protein PRZ48_002687 [Zasmidium cellare]